MPAEPGLAVVIVTHDSAAHVGDTLAVLVSQLGEQDELVVVDNGSRDGTLAAVAEAAPSGPILAQSRNLGFAGGCHAGAAATSAPLLLFLNPDAAPADGCLDALRSAAAERPGWGAWQALVTLPGGREVNTRGGVSHFLGFGWAGGCGAPVSDVPPEPAEVGFASGAAMVVRRAAWEQTGGFDPHYFMYGEDADLSLRLRLAGWGVGIVPRARVEHDYDFEKGPAKWRLLEQNRWRTLLAAYPAGLLLVLAPALVLTELALLPVAARGGWLAAKLRAQLAVLRELPRSLRRRRAVQRTRTASCRTFAEKLSASLDSPYLPSASRVAPLVRVQALYWRLVLRLLPARARS